MQSYQRISNPNKENMHEAGFNAGKKAIKLKHNEKRLLREQNNNQTAFFNPPKNDLQTQKQGEEKLIQLTAQCAQYFQRFTAEKDIHLQIIDRAFTEVGEKVELAFGKIILEAQRKLNEIRSFLARQHDKLKQQKQMQEDQLNKLLVQIKSVHLTKLDSSISIDLPQTLSEYAATLDKFFNVMTDIESNNYEDSVEECMSFINNLVRQELRTIEDKFPPKIEEMIGQFTSSDEFFTFEEDGIPPNEETVSLLDQMDRPNKENPNASNALNEILSIKNNQNVREDRINQYRTIITSNNPFKGIRLSVAPKRQQI